ncbi:MAG: transporter substrate-binding domain-containing protein [Methylococcales bacterium]|nr:transporter substrate-binding domain-containing protein [Methylococcales bacterium]
MRFYSKSILLMSLVLLMNSVQAQKVYTVGVEPQPYYPNFSYVKGQYTGYSRAVLDLFALKKGIVFKYKAYPIKRLFKMLLVEKIDFKYPDSPYWKSDLKKRSGKKVQYSHSVSNYIDGTMVLPANQNKQLGQIKTLGIVRGFTPWSYLDAIHAKKIRVVENSSLKGLIKQIIHKRIDGAYINVAVAEHHLKKNYKNKNKLVFNDSLPHSKADYYLSTVKHTKILEEFNQFLMDEAVQIKRLKQKYQVTIFD